MSAPARVLCVHPHGDLYGSDRMFLATVRALAAEHRVETVVGVDGPLAAVLRGEGFPVTVRPRLFVLRKAMIRRPWAFLAALPDVVATALLVRRTRPGWVYVSTVTAPTAVLGARLAGRRVVCHVHEAEGFPGPAASVLLAPLLAAHRVLSISGATTAFVTGALPVLARRVRHLPNTVAVPAAPPGLPDVPPDPVRLVVVGRISERKGTDVAVRAVAVLRGRGVDARLDLYGDIYPGYEWYADRVEALIAEHGLSTAVTRHGFVDDPGPGYAAAHLCVVPSRTEPFGLVAVEARLAGRVTLVSDIAGLRETVDDGASGHLVTPDDPEALADAVEKVLRDWPAAVASARASQERARHDYAPERYGANLRAALVGVDR